MSKQRTRIAAYGLIVRGGELLLCRLSAVVPAHQGKWTLPGGGIEFGESPEAAMVREVEEETGLVVEPDRLATVDSIVIVDEDGIQHHNLRVIYFATVTGGELRSELDGTTDLCQWWRRDGDPPRVGLAELGMQLAFAS